MSQQNQQTLPRCVMGLTSADLSAWRDETLPADEAARIAAHQNSCPACRDRLRGFEMVASALHAQRAPLPDERLWQAVQMAIATSERQPRRAGITREIIVPDASGNAHLIPQVPQPPNVTRQNWRRRALGTLAAVAAIALVVFGFGRLFQADVSNRQTFSVTWQQVTPPAGVGASLGADEQLAVSPADGSVAWLCQSGTKSATRALRVWRTSDAGRSWQSVQAPEIPFTYNCQMYPDQLDPNVSLLYFFSSPGLSSGSSRDISHIFETFDGGATWQNDQYTVPPLEFATLNGATYALRQNGPDVYQQLEVSRDGLQTWHVLDAPIHNQKLTPDLFWLNPATGSMLVEAHTLAGSPGYSLWTTDANGSHWQQVMAPYIASVVARPTADGQHWTICSLYAGTGSNPQHLDYTSHIACGTENARWTERPGFDIPRWTSTTPTPCASCSSTPNDDPFGVMTLLGIANDGALLATVEDRFDTHGQATRKSLYRLPSGSNQWQNGGAVPGPLTLYAPRPGGGLLWSTPSPTGIGDTTGPVFTASYPGPAIPALPTPQETPTATSNVVVGTPLAWQPTANLNRVQPNDYQLAIAPSDGRTAYSCSPSSPMAPSPPIGAWATHDGGASWSALVLPRVSSWCTLVVDEVNPRDVLLGVWLSSQARNPDAYCRSTDGGSMWQRVTGLNGSYVSQFATQGSTVFALRSLTPLSQRGTLHLQASYDGMATWHDVESAIRSTGLSVGQFWLNPYSGGLLATNSGAYSTGTTPGNPPPLLIWRSSDGGAHWRSLQAPQDGFSAVLVQPPMPNHTWGICLASGTTDSNSIVCGDDSGQAWGNMPALNTGISSVAIYTAITTDGAILALTPSQTSNGATTYTVFRLPSGASRWRQIGPTPEFSLSYAPAVGTNGMLWSVPVNGILTDAQGRIFRVAAP